MSNKGFTLIELIITIALLSIIAVISFVSINSVIKDSKVKDCESLVNNIKSATKEYVSDNRYNNIFNSVYDTVTIDASHLVNGNYLSSPIVNPFTNEDIDAIDIKISIELNTDYTVKDIIIEAPSILNDCSSGI